MGYLSLPVRIPEIPGKISMKKKKDRTYVQYELQREYNPEKKYNVPTRIVIGQQIRTKPEWMLPNEKYEQIFSEAMKNMTEEEREAAAEYIATRGEFRTLQVLFDQMYYEFQAQARRDPHEIMNEYKVEKINRVLDRLMELMEGKNYAVFWSGYLNRRRKAGKTGRSS